MEKKDQEKKSSENSDIFSLTKIKDKALSRNSRVFWTEEAYINYSDRDINRSDKIYFGLSINQKVIHIFLFIVFLGLGLLLARSVHLQVIKGDEYLATAEQNRIRIQYVKAPRGIIYDRAGRALVSNVPNFHLYITPFDFPKDEQEQNEIIAELDKIVGYPLGDRLEDIRKFTPRQREYFEPLDLCEDIPYDIALRLDVYTSNLSGVGVLYDAKRKYEFIEEVSANEYLYNSLSHIIGYEGKISEQEYDDWKESGYLLSDRTGKSGIELSYEKALKGKHGKKQIEVDSQGKEKKIIAQEDAERGQGVVLTIDLDIQKKLEELLRNELLLAEKKKGVAIAMNPQNGEILGMVSLPSYNNNDFAQGMKADKYKQLIDNEDNPLFNRVIKGEYPSGSTIKPVIASAALEEKIITENTSFLSTGGIRIGEWFFPDWKAGGHGLTDVKKALSDSVNTFFYIIGGGYNNFEGLGVKKINYYAALFGFGQATGIDLAGENQGFLPTPEWKFEVKGEQWYIGDTYHLAIGQGDFLVTPLQIANMTAIMANKGKFIKPHLVNKFISVDTGEVKNVNYEVERENFISPYNLNIVRQGMRQAVTFGSAKILSGLPVTSAAKTGTAQWGTDKDAHAWFTAFAPYEDAEIAVTVLIEEGEEGSVTAAPVAYDFLKWYFAEYKKL
ncbi:MAG TPA: penicillin-binding protein 2 [Candidatus Bipolaricaulota bacterium]|nr:penicillin-binding protein 2 [Candidatus Bipolaricaulota bacterium]